MRRPAAPAKHLKVVMEFANNLHGYIPFIEMVKILQNAGYSDADVDDAIAIVMYSKCIPIEDLEYCEDAAARNHEVPGGTAFCPYAAGGRF